MCVLNPLTKKMEIFREYILERNFNTYFSNWIEDSEMKDSHVLHLKNYKQP